MAFGRKQVSESDPTEDRLLELVGRLTDKIDELHTAQLDFAKAAQKASTAVRDLNKALDRAEKLQARYR